MRRRLIRIVAAIAIALLLAPSRGVCEAETHEAAYAPWSGYWWSFASGRLVSGYYPRGEPGPLAKYDYVTTGTYDGPAMAYGKEHYAPTADTLSWYGLCAAWSAASILEDEPAHKGIYQGTVFNVGDKKGLITACYDYHSRQSYQIADPVDFHRILHDFIGTGKRPVIMDLGTNGEVWNFPVFKYDIDYYTTLTRRHYTVTIYYADDGVDPDYVGTDVMSKTYRYYLDMDGDEVVASGWEEGSETIYPHWAYDPLGINASFDNGLDYQTVREIMGTNGDLYEGNDSAEQAAELWSGHYSLVAIGTDWFRVSLKEGDRLEILLMAGVDESARGDGGFTLRIYSPLMESVGEMEVEERGDGQITVEAGETGDYFLAIEPGIPTKEPLYDLSLQRILSWQGIFPVKPAGLWYTGAALLDPDGNGGRVEMTLVDGSGLPRISYYDPSASYLLGVTEIDFGLCASEGGYLRVFSDYPLKGLQAARHANDPRMEGADIIPAGEASGDLFFPLLLYPGGWLSGWETRVGTINVGNETCQVSRFFYGAEGEIIGDDTIELAAGERRLESSTDIEDIAPGALSMSVHETGKEDCLVGYLEFWDRHFQYRSAALVPTPLERNTLLIAPHIASGIEWPPHGFWRTDIAVMNTGDADTQVTYTAYDASGEQIAVAVHTLRPNQRFKEEAADIFLQVPAEDIASMKISSDGEPLCGMMLFRLEDGYQSAGVPLTAPGESTLYLPHLACVDSWHTGVALMNTSAFIQTTVAFYLMDEEGDILAETYRTLQPNQRVAATVKELFGAAFSPQARYLRARSATGQHLSGLYLMTTGDGMWMNGGVLK